MWKKFDRPPSEYFRSNMYCPFIDDRSGLLHIDNVGVENNFSFDNLTFETDYPHADSTWPHSMEVANKLMEGLSPENKKKLLRDNAARLLCLAN